MSARCTGEPISWLRLEGYHLGQLEDADRARVAEHLAACPACAECVKRLEADDAKPLAPMKVVPLRRRRLGWAAGALAAAAALALVVRAQLPDSGASRVKGSEVAFSLVRDDGQRIDGTDGVFRDGDAFEALVTCAPPSRAHFDLVVYDAKGASFPLEAPLDFSCGNSRRLPGAFRLVGAEPQRVCLVWSETAPDRRALAAGAPPTALCKQLTPSR